MWNCPWSGYAMGGWQPLFSIVWWILIIAAIVALIRWFRTGSIHRIKTDVPALEVLRIRYAKGEIDKKEFEEKKKDLENGNTVKPGTYDIP